MLFEKRILLIVVVILSAGISSSQAQWVSQDLVLKPGWNAIHLSCQPVPADCGTVFAGLPVETVAWWCRSVGDAEFQLDSTSPNPRSSHWSKWVPADPSATSFSGMLAGESYLVNLATNVSMTLHVRGTAVIVSAGWMTDEYNLVGFPVAANVTFGMLFSLTDRIQLDSIQQFLTNGSAAAVFRPANTVIIPGKAYWVKCGPLATDFSGSIRLVLGTSAKRLDFSGTWHKQTLRIINDTPAVRVVTVRHLASETPPAGQGFAPLAGKTPLLMEVADGATDDLVARYIALPDTLVTNVAANSELTLGLMPSVAELTNAAPGSAWQSVLRVTDEGNPENAGAALVSQQVGVYCETPAVTAFDPAGLWVGSVSVTGVSRAPTMAGVSNVWDATVPVPVVRPYNFRVLLHHDGTTNQQWRLLQRAYLVTDTNGADRVFTDTGYAQTYVAAHPECKVARISTANLPLIKPLKMTRDGTNLVVTVLLPHNDPTNPFVHPFHPQHDNKEYRNGVASPLWDGVESYTVTRVLNFGFAPGDPLHAGNPEWNISEMGGAFTEEVGGLNKTIYASGSFRLERVSEAGVLEFLDEVE